MEEKEKTAKSTEKKEVYECKACKGKYEVSEARKREFACCGQSLVPLEVITKSTPTPFGP